MQLQISQPQYNNHTIFAKKYLNNNIKDQHNHKIDQNIQKQIKNCRVNKQKLLSFDDSFQMIQPITHLDFNMMKDYDRVKKFVRDGIDEEQSATIRNHAFSPIHISKTNQQIKTNSTFNSKIRRKSQQTHKNYLPPTLNLIDPQKKQLLSTLIKPNKTKIKQLITTNIKNIQIQQSLIRQTNKINYNNKDKDKDKNQNQDKPIVKKSFKISGINFNINTNSKILGRLSQSKLAMKQEILLDSATMVKNIKESKLSKYQSNIKQSKNKEKLQKSKQILQHKQNNQLLQSPYSNTQSQQYTTQIIEKAQKILPYQMQPDPQPNSLTLTLKTPISLIKRTIIQSQETLQINFNICQQLLNPPPITSPRQKYKQFINIIFNSIGLQHKIISIKKINNKIQIKNKNLCIVWNYQSDSISGYFGQSKFYIEHEGALLRNGIGFQWDNSQNNKYMYYGQFIDNKKQGYGILKQLNNTYIGCWKNNKKQGWGKTYNNNNNQLIYNGEFIDNQQITNSMNVPI